MRPQQQNRRMRGRNNNNSSSNNNSNNNNNRGGGGGGKGNQNPLTRSYESNGPDVKIRGNAQQIAEKYSTLARDAQSSGDRVMAENYLQHAEHYNRIIAAAQAQMPIQNFQQNRDDFDDDDAEDRDDGDAQGNNSAEQTDDNYGSGPQPVIEGVPAEVALNGENAGQGGEGQPRQRDGFRNRDRRDRNRDSQNRNGNGEQPRRDFQRDDAQKPAPQAVAVEQSPVEHEHDSLPAFVTAAIPVIAAPEAESEAAPRVRKPRKPRKAADAPADAGEVVAAAEE